MTESKGIMKAIRDLLIDGNSVDRIVKFGKFHRNTVNLCAGRLKKEKAANPPSSWATGKVKRWRPVKLQKPEANPSSSWTMGAATVYEHVQKQPTVSVEELELEVLRNVELRKRIELCEAANADLQKRLEDVDFGKLEQAQGQVADLQKQLEAKVRERVSDTLRFIASRLESNAEMLNVAAAIAEQAPAEWLIP